MVHPHLLYCLPIYGCTSKKNISKLSKMQRKAIRTITKSSYNANTQDLFQSLEILPVEQLISYTQGLLIHSIYHKQSPSSLHNAWTLNYQRNEGPNLRNCNEFHVPLARSDQVKKLTLFSLPKIFFGKNVFFLQLFIVAPGDVPTHHPGAIFLYTVCTV